MGQRISDPHIQWQRRPQQAIPLIHTGSSGRSKPDHTNIQEVVRSVKVATMGKSRSQPGHEDGHARKLVQCRFDRGRQFGQSPTLPVHIDQLSTKKSSGR